LIELFEAISTTIEITEDADSERILQLTNADRVFVVGYQFSALNCKFERGPTGSQELPNLNCQKSPKIRPNSSVIGKTNLYYNLAKPFSTVCAVSISS
jgi:hypothetical protein